MYIYIYSPGQLVRISNNHTGPEVNDHIILATTRLELETTGGAKPLIPNSYH